MTKPKSKPTGTYKFKGVITPWAILIGEPVNGTMWHLTADHEGWAKYIVPVKATVEQMFTLEQSYRTRQDFLNF